eukprot:TRINITY_DN892_c1_g1_i2.p1 TRINITY_DN892_c1_g1~~TRINITY_DN892_c1_g1_i2.p1  ORF type:complete len:577 (+),score=108.02 TRINITY_DN892_c1_g1_i2:127-1857(+)
MNNLEEEDNFVEKEESEEEEEEAQRKCLDYQERCNQLKKLKKLSTLSTLYGEKLEDNETVCLEWKNISYEIREKNFLCFSRCAGSKGYNATPIISKIYGKASPGKMVAILGCSGVGKTTLLNILSKRFGSSRTLKKDSIVSGEIIVNGKSISKHQMKNISSYVLQTDSLLPFLTVEETLYYSIQFYYGPFKTKEFKSTLLKEVMEEFGLIKVRNTIVGNELFRGISGGQKRRLTIAIHCITNPKILFLDEPTSGLDGKTALNLIETLGSIARDSNRIVILSIHQPRNLIFKKFDQLILLAGQGRLVYSGRASRCISYFESLGYPMPHHENPADFIIDLITEDINNEVLKLETKERIDGLIDSYENDRIRVYDREENSKKREKFNSKNLDDTEVLPKHETVIKWFWEVFFLMHRGYTNLSRNKFLIVSRIIIALIMSFIISALYFQIGNNQSTINDRSGLLFFLVINTSFNELLPGVHAYARNRLVFYRDRDEGFYRVSSYYLSLILTDLPLTVFVACLYGTIVYFAVGLQLYWWKYGQFITLIVISSLIASAIGNFISSIFPLSVASIIAAIFMVC